MSADAGVEQGDRPDSGAPRQPVVLVLDRLRSAHNVGNIFRLAEVCRFEAVYTCGYTATPPHPKLAKTARGADTLVPCRHFADSPAALRELAAAGYHLLAVETVAGAPPPWDAPMSWPLALVFGNEALGIDPAALALCHGYTRLPVFGSKNSLNVGNCAAVLCYEAVRRLTATA
jgi:23S rRNA (guanosine2251-2'-O)-methyltransferase